MTGLEPAASGVTGQRSNQLSYTPVNCGGGNKFMAHRKGARDVIHTPKGVKQSQTFPGDNQPMPVVDAKYVLVMVGGDGLEPPTYAV